MKKIWGILAVGLTGLTLAGCGNTKTQAEPSKTTTSSSKTTKPSVNDDTFQINWDGNKDAQLAKYMVQLGQKQNQAFTRLEKHTTTEWYGTKLSKYIDDDHDIKIKGQVKMTNWFPKSSQGRKDKQNIVAAYADAKNHELYIFVENQKSHVVYQTKKAANSDRQLVFTRSTNKNLNSAFDAIIKGKALPTTNLSPNIQNDGKVNAAATTDDIKVQPTDDSNQAKANSNNQNQSSANQSADVPTVDFPSEFDGTWYGYEAGKLQKITINGSRMSGDMIVGGYTELHDVAKRSAEDEALAQQPNGKMDENKRNHWGAYSTMNANGYQWIKIKGWYQSVGAGTSYRISQATINEKSTPVLITAEGTTLTEQTYYYPTQALADQAKQQDSTNK